MSKTRKSRKETTKAQEKLVYITNIKVPQSPQVHVGLGFRVWTQIHKIEHLTKSPTLPELAVSMLPHGGQSEFTPGACGRSPYCTTLRKHHAYAMQIRYTHCSHTVQIHYKAEKVHPPHGIVCMIGTCFLVFSSMASEIQSEWLWHADVATMLPPHRCSIDCRRGENNWHMRPKSRSLPHAAVRV